MRQLAKLLAFKAAEYDCWEDSECLLESLAVTSIRRSASNFIRRLTEMTVFSSVQLRPSLLLEEVNRQRHSAHHTRNAWPTFTIALFAVPTYALPFLSKPRSAGTLGEIYRRHGNRTVAMPCPLRFRTCAARVHSVSCRRTEAWLMKVPRSQHEHKGETCHERET